VSDVLETEARRRFLETLSLYERQGTHEGPEAEVVSINGLGVTLTIGPERLVYARRATVGTATEISSHLGVLLSLEGERDCVVCGERMPRSGTRIAQEAGGTAQVWGTAPVATSTFSPTTYSAAARNAMASAACKRLWKIDHPSGNRRSGAYSPGFFPNGYLGNPTTMAIITCWRLKGHGFDPHHNPWDQLTRMPTCLPVWHPEPLQVTVESRKEYFDHQGAGLDFMALSVIGMGGTYTNTIPCPACQGRRLRPEYLATIGGITFTI
jgi:excinuclease ABC subunit A